MSTGLNAPSFDTCLFCNVYSTKEWNRPLLSYFDEYKYIWERKNSDWA